MFGILISQAAPLGGGGVASWLRRSAAQGGGLAFPDDCPFVYVVAHILGCVCQRSIIVQGLHVAVFRPNAFAGTGIWKGTGREALQSSYRGPNQVCSKACDQMYVYCPNGDNVRWYVQLFQLRDESVAHQVLLRKCQADFIGHLFLSPRVSMCRLSRVVNRFTIFRIALGRRHVLLAAEGTKSVADRRAATSRRWSRSRTKGCCSCRSSLYAQAAALGGGEQHASEKPPPRAAAWKLLLRIANLRRMRVRVRPEIAQHHQRLVAGVVEGHARFRPLRG